jgi:AcrR family transcriptional regulator
MSSRRRLTPEQRRDELLDAGAELFAERPYDEIAMEDFARHARVSRALIYHYFPTKGEFFAAIWKRAHDRLLSRVALAPAETVRDGVSAALAAHLDFYQTHVPLVFIANRSAIAADPAVRGPVAADMTALCDRVLDACAATGHTRDLAGAALAGWIAFVREISIEWLLHQRISREEVLNLTMAALDATAGAQLDLNTTPARRS